MTLSISRKILILVAVPVLFEVVLVGILTTLVKKVESARTSEAHARELGSHMNAIMTWHLRRVALLMMGKASSSNAMLGEAESCLVKTRLERKIVANLVSQDAEEKANWSKVTDLAQKVDEGFASATEDYDKGNKISAARKWSTVTQDLDLMFNNAQILSAAQERLQQEHSADLKRYDEQLQYVIYLSVLGSMLIAFGLAIYFDRGTAARLKVLMENTQKLAIGHAPSKALTGNDELAQIDKHFQHMYQDLTLLRQRERAILDSASEVICSIDHNSCFTGVNNAAEKMWGYPPDDLLGRRAIELIAEAEKSTVSKRLQEALHSQSEVRFEATVLRLDGTASDTEWSVTGSGEERSIYCVIHDVSERKQLERLKQDFVEMISHDLRTPLSSVLASLELISLPAFALSDEGHTHLTNAEKNLLRALALINQLLEMERIEAGMIKLVFSKINSTELLNTAISSVADLAEAKRISITFDHNNVAFKADADRLVQVLINLLGNALKFSDPEKKISLNAKLQGEMVRFSVKDQGRGIPADQRDRVFERFQQVHNGEPGKSGEPGESGERTGSGLGLAICKAIVAAHEGRIGVDSVEGAGSTFWFEIPARQ